MSRLLRFYNGLKLNIKFTVLIVTFVLIPIIFLSAWLFYSMEQNVITERKNALSYKLSQSNLTIQSNVDSINMSTQFFLSDQGLRDFLVREKEGEDIKAEELIEFYKEDIASLERMVNNNPSLYQIRVYVESEDMQEMMPILYRSNRMYRLDWAGVGDVAGWQFDYTDKIFDNYTINNQDKILSLVTKMEQYGSGQIGILEVAMKMSVMFPLLYENVDNQWSCFEDELGNLYFGNSKPDMARQMVQEYAEKEAYGESAEVLEIKVDGKKCVAGHILVKELGGRLILVEDISDAVGQIYRERNLFVLVAAILLIVLIGCIDLVVKRVLKQFYSIIGSIKQVQAGDLNVVVEESGKDEFGLLGGQINKMLIRIRQLMDDNIKHEVLVKNTEIRALQNQINAHFIYNVLESIKMMAEIDEKYEISDAITALGKLLRYSMRWTSANVTVNEELEYIRNYLSLINLRFDYEIYLSENLSEEVKALEIPKMTLQPIVENAIYHGIEQLAEDTSIYIKGILDGQDCIIEITDSGRGMSEEEVANLYKKIAGEIETSGGSGNSIGLKNVQDRIKMSFGEKYGISINSKLGCYTKIGVRIPYKTGN
ncbi:MAG: sensor histidine kinase [Lachnospiraceae bacterium]|nr:sensor histidine kinase [Lachnospiraceae bacterium]